MIIIIFIFIIITITSVLRLLALRELRTLCVAGCMQVYLAAGGVQVYSKLS